MANKRNTGAWKTPKDLTITKRMADGYWTDKSDDFGQEAGICPSRISGFLFEDLEQSKHAHIQRALHNTRTDLLAWLDQHKANTNAQPDNRNGHNGMGAPVQKQRSRAIRSR